MSLEKQKVSRKLFLLVLKENQGQDLQERSRDQEVRDVQGSQDQDLQGEEGIHLRVLKIFEERNQVILDG